MDEKLENEKKSSWGGKRENSGRKPMLNKEDLDRVKLLLAEHGATEDKLENKERLLVLMDRLYEEGKKGNIPAIKEYIDRQLGKSKESVDVNLKSKKLLLD